MRFPKIMDDKRNTRSDTCFFTARAKVASSPPSGGWKRAFEKELVLETSPWQRTFHVASKAVVTLLIGYTKGQPADTAYSARFFFLCHIGHTNCLQTCWKQTRMTSTCFEHPWSVFAELFRCVCRKHFYMMREQCDCRLL